jgi:hypothetical protein
VCVTVGLFNLSPSLRLLSGSIVKRRSLQQLGFGGANHLKWIQHSIQDCVVSSLSLSASLEVVTGSVHFCRNLSALVFAPDSRLARIDSSWIKWPVLQRVILPDSVLAVTESFCDCPSLNLVRFGQVQHLTNRSGFSRTALADVMLPASADIVAGFASDAESPHSLRISFGRDSRLFAASIARRYGFVGYPPQFLKAKREPLAGIRYRRRRICDRRGFPDSAMECLPSDGPRHASERRRFSHSKLSHNEGEFPNNDEDISAAGDGFSQAPDADEFEDMLVSEDGWPGGPPTGDGFVVPPASQMGRPPDLNEVDPNLIDAWLAAPAIPLDDTEEDKPDSETEAAALPELENDPISTERFVINIVESLHRSEPPLMMTPLLVIDAIVRLHGENARFVQKVGFESLTEYVREVTRLDDRPDEQPSGVAPR